MSQLFPLFLVVSTAITGFIALLNFFVLRPKRQLLAEGVTLQAGAKAEEAVDKILKEPIIVEYSISFFPVLLIVLVLRSFLAEPFQIPSGSMIPTLRIGDFILVNKFAYGIRLPVIGTKIFEVADPQNGDVMVFIPPHKTDYFIKRVVGIPGDKVRYENKKLYINGVAQAQEFVAQIPVNNPHTRVYEETLGGVKHLIYYRARDRNVAPKEWVVPEGSYFMMGDNRDDSSDSRVWGLVSEENIVGQAFAVWLHWEPGFNLPGFSRNGWID